MSPILNTRKKTFVGERESDQIRSDAVIQVQVNFHSQGKRVEKTS